MPPYAAASSSPLYRFLSLFRLRRFSPFSSLPYSIRQLIIVAVRRHDYFHYYLRFISAAAIF